MAAYIIFIRNSTKDADKLAEYGPKARAAKGDHQYTPLAYYGLAEAVEGDSTEGVVLLQFADMDAAKAWYHSDAYQEARAIRDLGADYRVIIFEGM